MNICGIVVTYNRKKLLLQCLSGILSQTTQVNSIIIVDNASTDNTWETIKEKYKFEKELITDTLVNVGIFNNIDFYYIKTSHNKGGAGGFSLGLRSAHSMQKFDAFWMMDDDGYPSSNCLEEQIKGLEKYNYDYVMPTSIDIENHNQLSWPVRLKNGGKTLQYTEMKESWGEIMNYIYPFNGSLLSKKIVDEVGYVNEKLFIWGDEYEHYWRCKKKGYQPITIVNAKFYHPANKMSFVPIMFGLIKVPFSESELRMVCLARNYTHIYWNYDNKLKIPAKFLIYTWLYLITRKFDFKGYKLYIDSVIDGMRGDFTRHLKYLK